MVMFVFALGNAFRSGGGEDARILLAGALAMAGIMGLIWFRKQPRRRALEAEARRLRLEYSEGDASRILHQPFALFQWTRAAYGDLDNVLSGSWRGFEVRCFDYAYARTEQEPRRLSCAMAAIPPGWPTLVIQPETLATTIADHTGLHDIGHYGRCLSGCCERPIARRLVAGRG